MTKKKRSDYNGFKPPKNEPYKPKKEDIEPEMLLVWAIIENAVRYKDIEWIEGVGFEHLCDRANLDADFLRRSFKANDYKVRYNGVLG